MSALVAAVRDRAAIDQAVLDVRAAIRGVQVWLGPTTWSGTQADAWTGELDERRRCSAREIERCDTIGAQVVAEGRRRDAAAGRAG